MGGSRARHECAVRGVALDSLGKQLGLIYSGPASTLIRRCDLEEPDRHLRLSLVQFP